jgi:hypothetical protein
MVGVKTNNYINFNDYYGGTKGGREGPSGVKTARRR